MIKEVKLKNFVSKEGLNGIELFNQLKNTSCDTWFDSIDGLSYRILDVKENHDDILESIISIETWNVMGFTPLHTYSYTAIQECVKLLVDKNKHIKL